MKHLFILFSIATAMYSCNSSTTETTKEPVIIEQDIVYSSWTHDVNMIGFAAYDSTITGKRPVVMVVHEWWGLNDYTKYRVRELAKQGYFAFAVDLYGSREQGNDPERAGKLATPFYQNPEMSKDLFEVALEKAVSFPEADKEKVAAIGYCFGGAQVLNYARLGIPLTGVVSFHGNLIGAPVKDSIKLPAVLVLHGNADPMVPQTEVDTFKNQMDSLKANYTFIGYDSATHAFSNPAATEIGQKFNIPVAYNEAADKASWQAMLDFFKKIF